MNKSAIDSALRKIDQGEPIVTVEESAVARVAHRWVGAGENRAILVITNTDQPGPTPHIEHGGHYTVDAASGFRGRDFTDAGGELLIVLDNIRTGPVRDLGPGPVVLVTGSSPRLVRTVGSVFRLVSTLSNNVAARLN